MEKRYQKMERYMLRVLCSCTGLFVVYLIASGFGISWLRAVSSIPGILTSAACLGYLYLTGEWLRRRSFWLTVWATAIVLCTLISLLLNYPSPLPG